MRETAVDIKTLSLGHSKAMALLSCETTRSFGT